MIIFMWAKLARANALRWVLAGTAMGSAGVAQAGPRLELGGYTGLLVLDDANELGNAWAPEQVPGLGPVLGLRVGYVPFALRLGGGSLELGVEAEARLSFSSTDEEPAFGRDMYLAPVLGLHGHLIIGYVPSPEASLIPFVVVGGGPETVFSSSPYVETDADAAVYWGAGLRYQLQPSLALRLDLRQGLTAARDDGATFTYEVNLGITKAFGPGKTKQVVLPQDSDDDGIIDSEDKCLHEPETYNRYQDEDGCPDTADNDNDGIKNDEDGCPDEAENFNGIQDEDGCPETDVDNDKILSHIDKCPNDAEDFDQFEDEDGCPDPDNDGDGVADAMDECPAEPETRNGYLDEDGCPDELPREVAKYSGVIPGIYFQTGDARIKPTSFPTLNAAVKVFRKYAELRILITGHTDDVGTREANLDLSKRRADAVKWWLVDRGIMPERIETEGKGPDEPKVPNSTAKGREQNRRIEFHLIVAPPKIMPAKALPAKIIPVPAAVPALPPAMPTPTPTPAAPATTTPAPR